MNWKRIVLLLLTLQAAYRLMLLAVRYRSSNNPTPVNVSDVYDGHTYNRWKNYNADLCRLHLLSSVVSYLLMMVLLLNQTHSAVAAIFGGGSFWELLTVLLTQCLLDSVIGALFGYIETMGIEAKYGFNRSSVKTFLGDQVRNFLLELLICVGLMSILALLYRNMGDWVILLFTGVMFCLTLVISFLYPIFSRLGNKFVPLEEGELKDRLMTLLTKHGYQVKAIEVMDASRRTTKLNAYFTGFGKMKTIVLYDNLLNAMTTDEICAVFAHELGHGLHKDVTKQQILNLVNLQLMALLAWFVIREPELHIAFGFSEVNYGFAYLLLGIGLGLLQPLTGLLTSAYSRRAEYRADRQAVQEGYGEALISALKKLGRENFVHLAPSRLLVILEYSHPPLSQRIAAIEKTISE